eukprot:9101728-Pyramimonas_sp.AAC.1
MAVVWRWLHTRVFGHYAVAPDSNIRQLGISPLCPFTSQCPLACFFGVDVSVATNGDDRDTQTAHMIRKLSFGAYFGLALRRKPVALAMHSTRGCFV